MEGRRKVIFHQYKIHSIATCGSTSVQGDCLIRLPAYPNECPTSLVIIPCKITKHAFPCKSNCKSNKLIPQQSTRWTKQTKENNTAHTCRKGNYTTRGGIHSATSRGRSQQATEPPTLVLTYKHTKQNKIITHTHGEASKRQSHQHLFKHTNIQNKTKSYTHTHTHTHSHTHAGTPSQSPQQVVQLAAASSHWTASRDWASRPGRERSS